MKWQTKTKQKCLDKLAQMKTLNPVARFKLRTGISNHSLAYKLKVSPSSMTRLTYDKGNINPEILLRLGELEKCWDLRKN